MPRAKRSSRARTVLLAALALVAVIAIAGGAIAWNLLYVPDNDIAAGESVEVIVEKGASTSTIAQQLASVGVVDNALMFRVQTRSANADGTLRAGAYKLTTGMGYEAAIAALQKGPKLVYVDVPIPEGFTAKQVAARFAKRTGVAESELLELMTGGASRFAADYPFLKGAYRDSLEGYLFPATYRVKEGASAEQIVRLMLDKFEQVFSGIDLSYARSKNLTPSDVVIIASAIEREARIDSERRTISSVIYNRLKARMRLQLCATVLYEMPPGTTRLTYADLELDSPYNTYKIGGLPPGPIANPGEKSLQAAARPKKTDYLYYVLTGEDGSHTFTSSYAEFQRAVTRSRELTAD